MEWDACFDFSLLFKEYILHVVYMYVYHAGCTRGGRRGVRVKKGFDNKIRETEIAHKSPFIYLSNVGILKIAG